MGLICVQSIGFTAFEWEEWRSVVHMNVSTYACVYDDAHFTCLYKCECLCAPQSSRGGAKPLRAVYTNAQTKDTSFSQTGREIYLPDRLEHLRLFKRKPAAGSRRSGTQDCCHIAVLNPQLVWLWLCERDIVAALWWEQIWGFLKLFLKYFLLNVQLCKAQ